MFFSQMFYFHKTHDFSRVTFATELSANLIYNSIFVIDYNSICILFVDFLYNKVVYI